MAYFLSDQIYYLYFITCKKSISIPEAWVSNIKKRVLQRAHKTCSPHLSRFFNTWTKSYLRLPNTYFGEWNQSNKSHCQQNPAAVQPLINIG